MPDAGNEWRQRFSSTRRGARLARHLAVLELCRWGYPLGGGESERVGQVVAELAANAVAHGCVPGRDFELGLRELDEVLRVEVSDARAGERPRVRPGSPDRPAEHGHGLRIVEALCVAWGVSGRVVGKTVWAEVARRPATAARP
ncbi:ATP-binding protein [Streptomyces subrutilus]|uniref:ATP-binding protein n=1 Tax=Streptomyces subrutilus TaxID=36818 RepID=A0A5P2ULG8_9ACTN|nr:ATP-binding protein [Streptomyces subrutilus]QEU79175.1 ATP-binding protein [Streptomyces subrutilus]WSJ31637.1 ATP-binding protein [Streptomyces subrutilus]GGZ52445.1 ATP-binding protein [Streptomyces subrutilus]